MTADSVSVTAPDETTVDMVLVQGGRISGTVTDGTSGIANMWVVAYDASCNYRWGAHTDSGGHYSIIGLETGSYKVKFQDPAHDFSEWYNGKADCETADTIRVVAPELVTLNVTLPRFWSLHVRKSGTGAGSITSSPDGISCGNICDSAFAAESTIDLTATALPGSVFVSWLGACLGNANTCRMHMNDDKSVTAIFDSIADFTALPTYGHAPSFVSFMDKSKNSPTSWSWSFGDGGSSSLQDPIHNYTSPGTYTVSLNISTEDGPCSLTKTGYIQVSSCSNPPARSGIYSYIPYSTIQAAYNTAISGEFVEAHARNFWENLNFKNNIAVTFRGGFNCGYETNEGQYTTVHGKVTISDGTATIENLVIQ